MAEEKTKPAKSPAWQSGGPASMASHKSLGGDDKNMGALFIPAGILLGLGLGLLLGNAGAWMFIGLGAGFLGFAITYIFKKK
jgi:hypothetical protein